MRNDEHFTNVPIELVHNDWTKRFFTVLSTNGFDLQGGKLKKEFTKTKEEEQTFSISFGMSSLKRSFRETGFDEVEENRTLAKAERRREGRACK
jgi:hypothetical protein